MTNKLIRGLLPEKHIRFALCQTADLCSEALHRHKSDALSGWLLSESLTCATLMSVGLKNMEKMTFRWMYDGPIGEILADTDQRGRVRGYTQRVNLMGEYETLEEVVGKTGKIAGITSLPNKVLNTGIIASVFQDVSKDMAHMLSLSFQVESGLSVGLIMPPSDPLVVNSAIGVLIQPLPQADMEEFDTLRQRLEQEEFRTWLEAEPHSLETVLEHLAEGISHEILETVEPEFYCGCTREKVESVLQMFEKEELKSMLEEEGKVDVHCHFCGEAYHFGQNELEGLINQPESGHA